MLIWSQAKMRYPEAPYKFEGRRVRGLLFAGCTLLYLDRGIVVLNPNTLYWVGGEWQTPTLHRRPRNTWALIWRDEEWVFR